MVFSYVSIINTVKLSHALTGLGDPTDRQRRVERDVTRVSLGFMLGGSFFSEIYLPKNWSQNRKGQKAKTAALHFSIISSNRV